VTIDSRYLRPLLELPDYLDKLSAALGVRLCMPEDSVRGDSLLLLEAEPLAVSVGIASMRKKGEAVSGDRGTYFKTDAGQLCVILMAWAAVNRRPTAASERSACWKNSCAPASVRRWP